MQQNSSNISDQTDSIIPDPKPDSTIDSDSMAPRSDDQKEEVVDETKSETEADNFQEDDAEAAELARLRCESVRTEEKKQPGGMLLLWMNSYFIH